MDGKQHLSLEGLSGASGMKTLADAIGTASVGAAGDAAKTPGKGRKGKKPKQGTNKDGSTKAETGYMLLSLAVYFTMQSLVYFTYSAVVPCVAGGGA